jgi:hypothetical protein
MKKCVVVLALFVTCCVSIHGVTQTSAGVTPDKGGAGAAAATKAGTEPKATVEPNTGAGAKDASGGKTGGDSKPAASSLVAPTYGFWVTYSAMGVMLILLTFVILRGLKNWSLSEALSEDGKASISRLLALLGFSVIISIYLGTGCGVIFRILDGGAVTDLGSLGTFLVGGAAIFTPYIANQIKGAVTGVASAQNSSSGAVAATATAFSPKVVQGGTAQKISVSGSNLQQAQGAIYTSQSGAESQLPAANVHVLNGGAIELMLTMDPPKVVGTPYQSTLTLLTKDGQRIPVGSLTVV